MMYFTLKYFLVIFTIYNFLSTRPFRLKSFKFEGDRTGVLHVGPGQTIVVPHPDDLEFLVNIYIYHGGTLILPTDFDCYGVNFFVW